MALIDLWKSNPSAIASLSIDQIVPIAGNGQLNDGSHCADELRQFLSNANLEMLAKYAERCLEIAFTNSGRVLQDVINEIGRRLDYAVTNGRYQGVKNQIGFDGIWHSPENHTVVVEVKTTDAYRIQLKTIAKYQEALLSEGKITKPCSILIIVGREDTGELEAQVRGSRYAWDIRLISIDALLKLARLKQETEDPETSEKIRTLLVPFDNTRLDEIIDVMFSTAADVSTPSADVAGDIDEAANQEETLISHAIDPTAISVTLDAVIDAVSKKLQTGFVKKTRATYWDSSHALRVICSISKPYNKGIYRYWYAYHPAWDDFLEDGETSYVVWGCLDLRKAFVIPRSEFKVHLSNMITTTRPDGKMYWHVKILEKEPDTYYLQIPQGKDLALKPYELAF